MPAMNCLEAQLTTGTSLRTWWRAATASPMKQHCSELDGSIADIMFAWIEPSSRDFLLPQIAYNDGYFYIRPVSNMVQICQYVRHACSA
jgi:hypothetical protein